MSVRTNATSPRKGEVGPTARVKSDHLPFDYAIACIGVVAFCSSLPTALAVERLDFSTALNAGYEIFHTSSSGEIFDIFYLRKAIENSVLICKIDKRDIILESSERVESRCLQVDSKKDAKLMNKTSSNDAMQEPDECIGLEGDRFLECWMQVRAGNKEKQ